MPRRRSGSRSPGSSSSRSASAPPSPPSAGSSWRSATRACSTASTGSSRRSSSSPSRSSAGSATSPARSSARARFRAGSSSTSWATSPTWNVGWCSDPASRSVLVLVLFPDGVAHFATALVDRVRSRRSCARGDAAPFADGAAAGFGTTTVAPKLLEVSELVVAIGATRVVDGVSLTVEPGRIVGLIGANGAGKTTLIDAVTGFQKISAGRIELGGRELGGASARAPRTGGAGTLLPVRRAVRGHDRPRAPARRHRRGRAARMGRVAAAPRPRPPRRPDARARGDARARRPPRPVSRRDLPRPEATRRRRPGARHAAVGAPPRRTRRRPRPRGDPGARPVAHPRRPGVGRRDPARRARRRARHRGERRGRGDRLRPADLPRRRRTPRSPTRSCAAAYLGTHSPNVPSAPPPTGGSEPVATR